MRFILLLAPHLQKNEMHFRIKSQEEWLVIDVKLTLWQRSIFFAKCKNGIYGICLFILGNLRPYTHWVKYYFFSTKKSKSQSLRVSESQSLSVSVYHNI